MDYRKKIVLDNKYELGHWISCWAKSYERNVKQGDIRIIGGKIMEAVKVFPYSGFFWMFVTYEVDWRPADFEIGDYGMEDLNEWKLRGLIET